MKLDLRSEWLSIDQTIYHPVSSLAVPLRSHMSDALESYQSEIIGQCPHVSTILASVGSSSVPRPPVLLSWQFQLLSQLVHPVNSARIWDCWVTVSRINHNLVSVQWHQILVHPVRSSYAALIVEVIVVVAHRVLHYCLRNAEGFAVVAVGEELVDAEGVDAGRSKAELVFGALLLPECSALDLSEGGLGLAEQCLPILIAGTIRIVDIEAID